MSDLGKLAYLIYKKLKREDWHGGKGISGWWPKELPDQKWGRNVTWTVSPPVEIGGHTFHVCISSNAMKVTEKDYYGLPKEYGPKWFPKHTIRVFCDGEIKYPGGKIEGLRNWWPSWSAKIAKQEIEDGGKTGPVEKRDLLIKELKGALNVVPVTHQIDDKFDEGMAKALKEVEALSLREGA